VVDETEPDRLDCIGCDQGRTELHGRMSLRLGCARLTRELLGALLDS
jgi:hypothetical protein